MHGLERILCNFSQFSYAVSGAVFYEVFAIFS